MHAFPKPRLSAPKAAPLGSLSLVLLSLFASAGCGPGKPSAAQETSSATGSGLKLLPDAGGSIGPSVNPELVRPNYHSFGHVPLGGKVSHVFKLKNTDAQPITVTRMKPACGCTVPSLSYDIDGETVMGKSALTREPKILVIPPGVTADLRITMDTHSVPITNVDKTVGVMLTTDSPNGFYLHVETHIFVEKPFTQNPSGINFGQAAINGVTEGGTDLILNPGYRLKLTGIASHPESLQVELVEQGLNDNRVWRLEARLLPPHELGVWQDSLFVNQEDEFGEALEPLEVRMRAQFVEDLVCVPARFAFGTLETDEGTPGGLEITLRSLLQGHAFGIEQMLLSEEHAALFEVGFEAVNPNAEGLSGSWKLSMHCKQETRIGELIRGSMQVILFDPQHPKISVDYVVHPPRQ